MVKIIVAALVVMNLFTFFVYGIDKWKARKNKWRVSEKTLLLLALCGGSLGAVLGMYLFHHKTKHWKFKILVPLFLIIHVALGVWVIFGW